MTHGFNRLFCPRFVKLNVRDSWIASSLDVLSIKTVNRNFALGFPQSLYLRLIISHIFVIRVRYPLRSEEDE